MEKTIETIESIEPIEPIEPPEPQISQEVQALLDIIPHSIPTLVKMYKSLTDFEKATLNKILRSSNNINHLLEFYMHNIYPSEYHFGIEFALTALAKHEYGNDIFNKIKNGIKISYAEEDILDYGGHSGASMCGLKYWLRIIFTKAHGDAFDNYHLVFDEGEFQRTHYLFRNTQCEVFRNTQFEDLLSKIADLQ